MDEGKAIEKLKVELTKARLSVCMSVPGIQEAFYNGKRAAFAEAIEITREAGE